MVNNKSIKNMTFLDKEDRWILDHVESEIVRAESDMEIMEYALEDVYSDRLETDKEYYDNAPIMLMHCHVAVLQELKNLQEEFKDTQEFEKCSVILKVRETLIKKFNIDKTLLHSVV